MSFFKTFEIASSGMSAQRTRMNVASMNMANKNTTRTEEGGPYKRRDVVLAAKPIDNGSFASRMKAMNGPNSEKFLGVRVENVATSDDPPILHYDPNHPDSDENGYVSIPNINAINEMMNMMGAARAYEAGTTVMRTAKRMLSSVPSRLSITTVPIFWISGSNSISASANRSS